MLGSGGQEGSICVGHWGTGGFNLCWAVGDRRVGKMVLIKSLLAVAGGYCSAIGRFLTENYVT